MRAAINLLFSDGKWHTTQEAIAVGAHLVRPERAMRRFLNRGRLSKNELDLDDEMKIIKGQRLVIQHEVHAMECIGIFEKQRGPSAMEYRKVQVNEARKEDNPT